MHGLILRFLNLTESNVGVGLNFYVQPRCSLCSKFASSCFCKNVSREGAKEQREKRIALTLSLLLCAFAGNAWLWLCCSVSLAVSVSTYITAETPRTQRLHRDLKLNNVRLAD